MSERERFPTDPLPHLPVPGLSLRFPDAGSKERREGDRERGGRRRPSGPRSLRGCQPLVTRPPSEPCFLTPKKGGAEGRSRTSVRGPCRTPASASHRSPEDRVSGKDGNARCAREPGPRRVRKSPRGSCHQRQGRMCWGEGDAFNNKDELAAAHLATDGSARFR